MGFRDNRLVRGLKNDVRAAFVEFVDIHYRSIYRQLLHLCGDTEVAADLTQETFAQAWRSIESFEGQSTLRTWIHTIAVRIWHKWRHRRGGREDTPFDDMEEELLDTECGPAELCERRSIHDAVRGCLLRLPAAYRVPLVLHYLQDMKYEEISVALRIPVGTVKSRIHKGLEHMKAALTPILEGESVR